jgi:hypothetical protein
MSHSANAARQRASAKANRASRCGRSEFVNLSAWRIGNDAWRARRGKVCFFEKKQQKTFVPFGCGLPGKAQPGPAKVFWFFFSKKNRFLWPGQCGSSPPETFIDSAVM